MQELRQVRKEVPGTGNPVRNGTKEKRFEKQEESGVFGEIREHRFFVSIEYVILFLIVFCVAENPLQFEQCMDRT